MSSKFVSYAYQKQKPKQNFASIAQPISTIKKKKIGQILCPRLIFEYPYFKRKKKCQICSQEKLNAREVIILFLRENVGFNYFLEYK